MYIFSFETSTQTLSLGLSLDGKLLRSKRFLKAKLLEDALIKAMDAMLKAAKIKFKDVDALALSIGPGSFTSLRVGLSMVKAFAMASGKKVVGIPTLDIIAQACAKEDANEICVINDARRGNVYAAIYQGGKLKSDYELTKIEDILTKVKGRTFFVGNALALYKQDIVASYKAHAKKSKNKCEAIFADEKFWEPQIKFLAQLAYGRLAKKDYDNPAKLLPIYLYPQDCQVTSKMSSPRPLGTPGTRVNA